MSRVKRSERELGFSYVKDDIKFTNDKVKKRYKKLFQAVADDVDDEPEFLEPLDSMPERNLPDFKHKTNIIQVNQRCPAPLVACDAKAAEKAGKTCPDIRYANYPYIQVKETGSFCFPNLNNAAIQRQMQLEKKALARKSLLDLIKVLAAMEDDTGKDNMCKVINNMSSKPQGVRQAYCEGLKKKGDDGTLQQVCAWSASKNECNKATPPYLPSSPTAAAAASSSSGQPPAPPGGPQPPGQPPAPAQIHISSPQVQRDAAALQTAQNEIRNLQNELSDAYSRIYAALREARTLEVELARNTNLSDTEIQRAEARISELNAASQNAQDEIDQLNVRITELRNDYDAQIADLMHEIRSIQERYERKEADLTRTAAQLEEQGQLHEAAQLRAKSVEAELIVERSLKDTAVANAMVAAGNLESARLELQEAKNREQAASNELAELQRQGTSSTATAAADLSQAQQDLQRATENVSRLQQAARDAEQRAVLAEAQLKAANDAAQETLRTELERARNAAQQRVLEAQAERDTARRELNEARSSGSARRRELAALQTELRTANANLEAARSEKAEFENQLRELRERGTTPSAPAAVIVTEAPTVTPSATEAAAVTEATEATAAAAAATEAAETERLERERLETERLATERRARRAALLRENQEREAAQREREAEAQRQREAEAQRQREAEAQRQREAERQRGTGETKAESGVAPPFQYEEWKTGDAPIVLKAQEAPLTENFGTQTEADKLVGIALIAGRSGRPEKSKIIFNTVAKNIQSKKITSKDQVKSLVLYLQKKLKQDEPEPSTAKNAPKDSSGNPTMPTVVDDLLELAREFD